MIKPKKMKKYILLAIVSAAALSASAQLTIGGHLAVLDSLTSTYLCPVAKTQFGTDLVAPVTYTADSTATVTIDDAEVAWGAEHTFAAVEGGKRWAITMADGDSIVTRYITFTYLPVMVMNGEFGSNYTLGTIQVLEPENYTDELMPCKVKWRGASTALSKRHKRNYHLKFVDEQGEKMDRKFMGLRKDNSWIMDAGQIDFLRVRNRVATQIWNDFATLPYYADLEPKVKTGVDGGFVEVILNGKYVGFYALTEAMDRKQMKLAKYDPETLEIRGQLWKTTVLSSINSFMIYKPEYDNTSDNYYGIETKYPELDEVCPTEYKTLVEAIAIADTSTVSNFNHKADAYFDIPVLIDYEIFLQVLLATDSYSKNIYWFCYDRTADKKLSLGVWDLDTSVGGNWETGSFHPSSLSPTRSLIFANGTFGRISLYNSRWYRDSYKRYRELRNTFFTEDNIISYYENAVNEVTNCGAVAREEARWSRDSDLSGRELNIASELEYVKDWIRIRLPHLDANRYAEPVFGDVNGDRVVDINDINVAVNCVLHDGIWDNWQSDVNQDGTTDVVDINNIINVILNAQ